MKKISIDDLTKELEEYYCNQCEETKNGFGKKCNNYQYCIQGIRQYHKKVRDGVEKYESYEF